MIISKCPLRVSLVGGSTDLQVYLDKYKKGSVISFPIDKYTYIILKKRFDKKIRIVYSQTEDIINYKNISSIKNDIVRQTFKYFDSQPLDIIFESDIPSVCSGLASSSSHTVALIYALSAFYNISITQIETCCLAHKIELTFNPLTGYQDPYGCGIGSMKKMIFNQFGLDYIKLLSSYAFETFFMYLFPTNTTRSSTQILNTLDINKIYKLSSYVNKLEKNISSIPKICKIINDSWIKKIETSPKILNADIKKIEQIISGINCVKAYKLCGAGGGGYFFVISTKRIEKFENEGCSIKIDNKGVTSTII